MKKLFTLVAILASMAVVGNVLAQETSSDLFQQALAKEKGEGNLEEAIVLFQKVVDRGEDEALAAQAQLHIGICYEKLGLAKAREAYQKVLDRFPNQGEVVRAAREKLARLQKGLPAEKEPDKRLQIKLVASNFGGQFGMVSPDGKSIAIRDSQSGNLAVRDIETGQVRRVTNESRLGTLETFIVGQWSPDGEKIAYAWFNKDNYTELRLIETDGSEPRILFQEKDCQILPNGWSPDGRFILASVLRKYVEYQIVLVSTSDGSVQVLKTSTVQNATLVMGFSPDGRYIAYDAPQKEKARENDIFLLSRDGKQEIRLVEHPAQDKFLAWVPNSNALLFASSRALSMDVWMLRVADGRALGEPVLVKKDIGDIKPLGITNKGTLFYGVGTYMVDLYEAGIDLDKGVVVDPPTKLNQDFLGPIYSPKWSPDGKSLAYLVEKREAGKPSAFFICVRTENQEVRSIPLPISFGRRVDWSADGRSLFAEAEDLNLRRGLFRIDPLTGSSTLLSHSESAPDSWIAVFAVAPDGKSVFYVDFQLQNKLSIIFQRDLATGQEKEVYRKVSPPGIGDLMVSPDSQSLSFTTSDKPMWSGGFVIRFLSLADGKTRDILQEKIDQYRPQVLSWDGKSLVYAMSPSGSGGGKAELWRVLAAGGETTIMNLGFELKGDVDLSPDGKRLVYTSGKAALEIWAMENFLPPKAGENK
jgi:Tol biopolymer transport system component